MSCVNPSAKCPQLDPLLNGQLEPGADIRVFGTVVTFSCDEGYKLSQAGDPEIQCQGNREWSGTPPTCVLDATCGTPGNVDNARHDGQKNTYDVGERVTYNCNSGYFKRGLSIRRCLETGQWTGILFECVPKSCGNPGDIPNGRRIGSVFTFPSRVYYECNTGYELLGREYRACQTNQEWSGSEPECRPVSCPRQVEPEDGSMFGSQFTYGEQVRFHCYEGFKLVGSEYRTCQSDGTWSGEETSCREINCGPPEPIWNGYVDRDYYGFRSIIMFECNPGTILDGSRSTYCQEDETWSSPTPNCWKMCEVDPPPVHGSYRSRYLRQGTSVVHGTTVDFNCNGGYILSHQESATCYNGTWENVPTCNARPCTPLQEPPHGSTDQDRSLSNIPHNTLVTYTCDRGYYVQGHEQKRCWFGAWSPRPATNCVSHRCPFDRSFEHGTVTFLDENDNIIRNPRESDLTQGTKRQLNCDHGYTLAGDGDVSICDVGHWTENNAVCNEAPCHGIAVSGILRVEYDNGDGQSYPHGTTATFTCSGSIYEVHGLDHSECRYGQWSNGIPQCVPASCRVASAVNKDHGALDSDPPKISHGASAQYRCNDGYEVEGSRLTYSKSIQCRFGTWRDSFPDCVPATCSLHVQAGLNYVNAPRSYLESGESISFSCDEDLIPDPENSQVTCVRGTFNPRQPRCIHAPCLLPPVDLPLLIKNRSVGERSSVDHGTEIEMGCTNGFMLSNGDSRQICHDGRWKVPISNPNIIARNPVCQQDVCDPPESPQNGRVVVHVTESNQQIAYFYCDNGFDLTFEPSQRSCQNGQWGGGVLPTCVEHTEENANGEKFCEKPPLLPNGRIRINGDIYTGDSVDAYPEGTALVFSCISSYFTLIGSETSVCQDGTWTPSFPTCVDSRSCGCPNTNDNLLIYYNKKQLGSCHSRIFSPGSVLTQRCTDIGKYVLRGTPASSDTRSFSRTCSNSQWTHNAAICESSLGEITWEGDSPHEVTEDGRLVVYPLDDTLFYVDCRSTTHSHHHLKWYKGNVHRGSYSTRNEYRRLRFKPPSARLSGTYTCWYHRYGTWQELHSITIEIQEVQCPNIATRLNGFMQPERHPLSTGPFILGDKVLFSCGFGYQLLGVSSVTCTYRGEWSDAIPTCQSNTCPDVEAPENGSKTHGTNTVGSKIGFVCNQGYILEGADEIECQLNFQWSASIPTCRDERECGDDICEDWEICVDRDGVKECSCRPPSHCEEGDNEHVCGTDGRTYRSLCRLNAVRCSGTRDVYKASDGYCPDDEGQPENGGSGESKEEQDDLCENNCQDGIEECFINSQGNPDCRCIDDCNDEESLVCGTDGTVYNNECRLRIQRCETKLPIQVDETWDSCRNTEEGSPEETEGDGSSCHRTCSPDTLEVACERAQLGQNFVVIGNFTGVRQEDWITIYSFAISTSIPMNNRVIGHYELVRGPARDENGCYCPQIDTPGTLYVLFGIVATDGTHQLKVEHHNYAAVLNERERHRLTTQCPDLFQH